MFLKVVKQPCPFSHDPLPSGGNCQRFSVNCGDQGFSFITSLLLCLHHPPRPQSCTQGTTGTSTTKKYGSNAGAENQVTQSWPWATAAAVKRDHAQHVGQPLLPTTKSLLQSDGVVTPDDEEKGCPVRAAQEVVSYWERKGSFMVSSCFVLADTSSRRKQVSHRYILWSQISM